MKLTKIFAVAGALALSSFAMAEGGGDRTFEKMMAAKDLAMEKYVAKQNASMVSSDEKNEKAK
ncbi:co-regulatory protein PtrA N-terminal domain-containing protein [Pseudomonas sp. MPDS]|uniref:co-regulatory protein PtrA N-terminal domain-containing protein n=1 Tax=Pseudomonas sp. MPDS TaxID=2762896 RepID=UPI000F034A4D|nr:co-regulatory protein PtrA N-terminal domain-containing protein [Pseudomonas sp. MPDS]QKJ33548.1 hypothetical protein HQ912_01355 [Pseudomonas sp. MPDS]